MIYVGIDDTDTLVTRGTNQVARALAARAGGCVRIVRHQLLLDDRVPYTSKNSAACLLFAGPVDVGALRAGLEEAFVEGSDPGLCVAEEVPGEVADFGRRCQREVVTQSDALDLARAHGIHLEPLGGTGDGVIGALAAIGLSSTGDDGRVVQLGAWPDDLSGLQPAARLKERGVDEIRPHAEHVDVGKKLRPALRGGKVVLFTDGSSRAVRI